MAEKAVSLKQGKSKNNTPAGIITMTPREIELLTIAKLEHEGHQLTPADQREIQRSIQSGLAHRARFSRMMNSPAYQWKKPATPRR